MFFIEGKHNRRREEALFTEVIIQAWYDYFKYKIIKKNKNKCPTNLKVEAEVSKGLLSMATEGYAKHLIFLCALAGWDAYFIRDNFIRCDKDPLYLENTFAKKEKKYKNKK